MSSAPVIRALSSPIGAAYPLCSVFRFSRPALHFEISADGAFEFDKAVLTPVGHTRMDTIVQDLKSAGFRARSITVVGYIDPLGKPDYNRRLSVARANAVRVYMVNAGVPAGVIQTEGRGETPLKVTETACKAPGPCQEAQRPSRLPAAGPPRRDPRHGRASAIGGARRGQMQSTPLTIWSTRWSTMSVDG
ncbi:OmpA family protein [Variovorax sp. dw_954]|uniref:OmpA family protein n=1 Tax=Variovorax sp. dw_954 TaxID=2720078 RepID=UPI002116DFAB|nr:OmpA family protein [Variovorax sp. dw_954]